MNVLTSRTYAKVDGFASIPSEVLGAIVRQVLASILTLEFVKISMSAKILILFVVWIVNAKIVQDLTGCTISNTFIPTYPFDFVKRFAIISFIFRCICKHGFRKSGNNTDRCVDIDECSTISNICQQRCANMWGSYRCHCRPGYRLAPDGRSCLDIGKSSVEI